MASKSESTQPIQPPIWQAYWKLTRLHLWPAGTILFFWPCIWGLMMSAHALGLTPKQVGIQAAMYLIGCTIRHNIACIWNDICDRDLDRQVERTKTRPIASGRISVLAGLLFMAVHIVPLLAMFSLAGPEAFKLSLFGLLTFELVYPLSKRFTNWPQAWLGFDCAWGFPVVWVSNSGYQNMGVVIALVLGVVCWTIIFDTIYAVPDKAEDLQAGNHSCAILFGDYIRPILSFFAVSFVASLAYAGYANGQGLLYFIISVGGAALHMLWQLTRSSFEEEGNKIWKSNGTLGYIIWGGMLLDYAQKVVL